MKASNASHASKKPIRRGRMRQMVRDENMASEEQAQNELPADKAEICKQVIENGYVQAYVDLFYLSHRADPKPDANGNLTNKEIAITKAEMEQLRDNLVEAEKAKRKGQTRVVMDCYTRLAAYFEEIYDVTTSIFFLEKCIEVAKLTRNQEEECNALHNLGAAYVKELQYMKATKCHEEALGIAKEMMETSSIEKANLKLTQVYRKVAGSLEETEQFPQALEYYEKCVKTAKEANHVFELGQSHYCLAKANLKNNQAEDALTHLIEYIAICKQTSDLEGEGHALALLATVHEQTENVVESISVLQRYLDIAEKTENSKAQADACRSLGIIYNTQREFKQAEKMFQKYYTITKTIVSSGKGSQKLLDAARIYVGMAIGNANMPKYISAMETNVPALVDWKINRKPLPNIRMSASAL